MATSMPFRRDVEEIRKALAIGKKVYVRGQGRLVDAARCMIHTANQKGGFGAVSMRKFAILDGS